MRQALIVFIVIFNIAAIFQIEWLFTAMSMVSLAGLVWVNLNMKTGGTKCEC